MLGGDDSAAFFNNFYSLTLKSGAHVLLALADTTHALQSDGFLPGGNCLLFKRILEAV